MVDAILLCCVWIVIAASTALASEDEPASPASSPTGQAAHLPLQQVDSAGVTKIERGRSTRLGDDDDESTAATLEFVRQHQSDLSDLLKYLKANREADYRVALKEIRRVRERLENLKKRDLELHDVELAIWQNSAQLRLWAAAMSASSKKLSDADRQKLMELVTRENVLTTERLTLEKARTEARLEQLNQQLARRKDQGDSLISKGIKTWQGRIERPDAKGRGKVPAGESRKQSNDRS